QGVEGQTSSGGYNDGNWHHGVVRCRNNSNAHFELWIDNVKVLDFTHGSRAYSQNMSAVFFLGAGYNWSSGAWGTYLTGVVDEVGLWLNKYLSDAEIAELYDGGVGLQYPFVHVDLPVLDTLAVDDITTVSATLNGEITDVGVGSCVARGFVYDTSSHADPGD